MKRSTPEMIVAAGYGATLIAMLVVGAMAWRYSVLGSEAARLVVRAHHESRCLEQIRSRFFYMESYYRAYFINGMPVSLERYLAGKRSVIAAFDEINGLLLDEKQIARVQLARKAVEEDIAIIDELMDTWRTEGFEAVRKKAVSGYAARVFALADKFIGIIDEAKEAEERILQERQKIESERTSTMMTGIMVLITLASLSSIVMFLVVLREYGRRKKIEAHQARLAAILEATPDMVCSVRMDGRVFYMNAAAQNNLGFGDPRNTDIFIRDAHPKSAYARLAGEAFPAALKTGAWVGESVFLTRTGREIPVSQVILAHHADSEDYYSTIARDITDRKAAEQAVAEAGLFDQSHRQALVLYNSAHDQQEVLSGTLDILARNHPFPVSAVYLYDEWRGVYVCKSAHGLPEGFAREITSSEGLIGQAMDARRKVVLDDMDDHCALVIDTGIEKLKAATVAILPISHQERRVGAIVLAATRKLTKREHDFVERLTEQLGVALNNLKLYGDMKFLAEQLQARGEEISRKNEQLVEADRMKSEFLSNMSHELRTPLNSIIGFSEILMDGLKGDLAEPQRECLKDIHASGTHLLALINDILDLSKVEAGKMTLDISEVDIDSLLHSSMTIIKEKAQAHNITLHCESDQGIGTFFADERKVKQILFNMLSNAVKFTPDGGAVRLKASRVGRWATERALACATRLPSQPADNAEFLEISVSDTGIGIPKEGLRLLFQPFMQLDGSLRRQFEGTGLGLAMIKKLAELHGGCVGMESEENRGSCFTVWLPLRQEHPGPEDAEESVRKMAEGEPVALLVEPDENDAAFMRRELESMNIRVVLASAFSSAERLAREVLPSVIIADIQNQEDGAWEFLSGLKQARPLASIPVILVTLGADRSKGMALGASMVLQKPVEPHDLARALADIGLCKGDNRPSNVLVVDDDPKAVDILSAYILREGHHAHRAYGGQEALDMARRLPVDLVLLDLMMPEVSGLDVLAALKASPETAAIPVLVITAKQITAEDRAKINGQVLKIVEKSEFSSERFLAEVRRALRMK